jgi:hypothetical protein
MEEPIRRAPQPQKPIVTPDMGLTDPEEPAGTEDPTPEQPKEDPPKDKNLLPILAGVGGGVVVLAVATVGVVLVVKKKKK